MTADDEKRFRLIIREEFRAAIGEGLTYSGASPLASPISRQQQTERMVAEANMKIEQKIARKLSKLQSCKGEIQFNGGLHEGNDRPNADDSQRGIEGHTP